MNMSIEKEPNDLLLVKLLGIKHITVYYNNLDTNFPGQREASAADVFLETDRELTENEEFAIRAWTARKTGVSAADVTISR